jgi:hypothetical protein
VNRGQTRAAYCLQLPIKCTRQRTRRNWIILLAMHFGWWDVLVGKKKPLSATSENSASNASVLIGTLDLADTSLNGPEIFALAHVTSCARPSGRFPQSASAAHDTDPAHYPTRQMGEPRSSGWSSASSLVQSPNVFLKRGNLPPSSHSIIEGAPNSVNHVRSSEENAIVRLAASNGQIAPSTLIRDSPPSTLVGRRREETRFDRRRAYVETRCERRCALERPAPVSSLTSHSTLPHPRPSDDRIWFMTISTPL